MHPCRLGPNIHVWYGLKKRHSIYPLKGYRKSGTLNQRVKWVVVFEGLSIMDDAPEPYMDVLVGRCVSLYTRLSGRAATPEKGFSKIYYSFALMA